MVMTWNLIDWLLIVLVLLSVVSGWRRGFILGMFNLGRWVGSLLLGLRFYQPLAQLFGPRADWPGEWDQPIAFVVIVIAASVLIYLLEYQILKRLPRDIHRRTVNRVFGIIP